MTALATGGVSQSGLVERDHFDQLGKLDSLDHQLSDPITAPNRDGRGRVEVDQGHLDFTAIAGIDGARAIDDRKSKACSQTGAR